MLLRQVEEMQAEVEALTNTVCVASDLLFFNYVLFTTRVSVMTITLCGTCPMSCTCHMIVVVFVAVTFTLSHHCLSRCPVLLCY